MSQGNKTFDTESIVTFKNGQCIITKRVTVYGEKNKHTIQYPSNAIRGTIWLTVPEESKSKIVIKQIIPTETEVESSLVDCNNISQLVLANVGKTVEFSGEEEYKNGEYVPIWIKGTIKNSLFGRLTYQDPDGNDILFHHEVKRIRGKDLCYHTTSTRKEKALEVTYETKEKQIDLLYSYFTNGLSWCPAYHLQLDPEKKTGKLEMQATIINNIRKFKVKEILCAAGSPKTDLLNGIDPLVGGSSNPQRTPNRIQSLYQNSYTNRLQNFVPQQQSSSQPVSTGKAEDYFYYRLFNRDLEVDRFLAPLFSSKLIYDTRYHCKITANQQESIDVEYALLLTNPSDITWTTAPVIISSPDQDLVGQSKIPYVTPNQQVKIDVATAFSVRVAHRQTLEKNSKEKIQEYGSEVDAWREEYRKLKDNRLRRKFASSHSKVLEVTNQCEIEIENTKAEPIVLNVSRSISGVLSKSLEKPIKEIKELSYKALNYKSFIEFELKLKANEKRIVKYEYVEKRTFSV